MHQLSRFALAGMSVLLLTGLANAKAKPKFAVIEDTANKLYQQGKFVDAFAAYQQSASLGSPRSQALLGYMYATGQGTAKNPALAMEWTSKAAEQDDAEAENML